ncbi:MAG: hypothetical protein ACKVOW_16470 [Chitinophagaceae bacterium]
MKYFFICLFCFFYSLNNLVAQQIDKKWIDKTDSLYGYYAIIKPSSGHIQGALILIDGFGGNADNFLTETKIHNVASTNDILTVCIPNGGRLYLDSSMTQLLNQISSDIKTEYALKKNQFAIGGMSSGGTIALRYAELCNQYPSQYPIQPGAVFNVDGPIDLIRLYKSSERDWNKRTGDWWLYESKMIIDRLKAELGDPDIDMSKYKKVSPLLADSKDSTNESSLKHIGVRTYHDVDADWFIKNRRRSLYETNLLDGSELINRLYANGNLEAEFMRSKIPGQRSNGQKHPHSWNIVDEIDLVQWIKKQLQFYPEHIKPSFYYPAPIGWEKEIILFPIDFATQLHYKGFEELRFAPGWGDAASVEKWAYTLLWWLDDHYQFDETILKNDLQHYFTGLTRQRAATDKTMVPLHTPAIVQVQKTKTAAGDKETFLASAAIFDAQVTQKPGKLFFKIHIKDCPSKNRTILLIEAAAANYPEPVWQQLDRINADFSCEAK